MKRTLLWFVLALSISTPAVFAEILRCESDYGHRRECRFEGDGRIELSRQISRTACIEGRTWGKEGRHTVWVSDGCRADFHVFRNREENRDDRRDRRERSRLVVCESDRDSRHRCEVDTSGGVRIERQISRTDCVLNRTWGYDSRGIWVRDGCRAEFRVGR